MSEWKAEIHQWKHKSEPPYPDKTWYVSKQFGFYTMGLREYPDYLYLHSDGVWRKSASAEMGHPGAYYESREEAQKVIDQVEGKEVLMEPDQCIVCPCCKSKVIHPVENTEPDSSGEYKAVWHCNSCNSLWYLVVLPEKKE